MTGRIVILSCVVAVAVGCTSEQESPEEPAAPFRGQTISVRTPNRPELVRWLNDQRGEWTAQTGAEVRITEMPEDGSAPTENAAGSADILIYPASEVGEMIAAARIAEVPKDVLDTPTYERKDLAPAVVDLVSWNRKPHAIPLSAEAVLLYYQPKVLSDESLRDRFREKHGRELQPPATWKEFDELAAFLDDNDFDGDGTPDRSVAVDGLAQAVIARAASYGKVPQNVSFYFDVKTFEPLVNAPAFRQSLDEWAALAPYMTERASDPGLAKLQARQAALGIGSSHLARNLLAEPRGGEPRSAIACAPLPSAHRSYLHDSQTWVEQAGKPNRSALVNALVASVSRNSPYAEAAWNFLVFLTNRETSLAAVTNPEYQLGPYRQSHLVHAAAWTASGWSRQTTPSFLDAMRASLGEANSVTGLRILGAREYEAALGNAMLEVLGERKEPEDSIQATARKWREITEQHGPDRQRRQYRYSLGIPVID